MVGSVWRVTLNAKSPPFNTAEHHILFVCVCVCKHVCGVACRCVHARACGLLSACYQCILPLSFFLIQPDSLKVSGVQLSDSNRHSYSWYSDNIPELQYLLAWFLSRKRSPNQRRRRRRRSESSQTLFTSSFCISATTLWLSAGKYTLTVTHLATWHQHALLHLCCLIVLACLFANKEPH